MACCGRLLHLGDLSFAEIYDVARHAHRSVKDGFKLDALCNRERSGERPSVGRRASFEALAASHVAAYHPHSGPGSTASPSDAPQASPRSELTSRPHKRRSAAPPPRYDAGLIPMLIDQNP
jgi:hypothetical protein